ncbi:aminotransferase class V-fold PLP-dependent enzyme [Caldivirga maquilingensis]|uniref:Pyridoxal phosphate-dependent enzyme, putative n=1 Tax=Caldivirga maquilingensis (strain ATCC 700844 / DSM 13496 / JCM 10307 / IC-167) TaxID=397948 RepID=A8MDW5_CALMQ|nr:DegT/DnrJ/EryC1/StrS family aminotransferase [Caldivirga maquilingensis]ABW01971.1 pyridoxal phosphate-dependent enzyme, putative [Caldivirga maquilingensis IC-167]
MGVLDKLGVRKVINACGTLTVLGSNRVSSRVLEAMREVADSFIDMNELLVKSGEYIAKLLNVPGALVTSGAGAGLVLAVAAAITEGDVDKMSRLPFTDGLRNEIIIQYPHTVGNPYVYLINIPGGRVRIVGSPSGVNENDIKNALNKNTAAVLHFQYEPQEGEVPLSKVIDIAHEFNTPVIVDAAAELPPLLNLTRFIKMGADLVVFSGGKDIGAPGDTGLILANNLRLLEACRLMSPFSYINVNGQSRVFIGRVMKISKEDIVALVAALEEYVKVNHEERLSVMNKMADEVISELTAVLPGIRIEKRLNHPGERIRPVTVPKVEIKLPRRYTELYIKLLREGDPPIYACECEGNLCINMHTLSQDEVPIVINRLKEVISRYPPVTNQ